MTETEWRGLWERVDQVPPMPLPPGSIGIGIFLGERRSGGYAVGEVSVTLRDRKITVLFDEITPAPTARVVAAITTPYLIQLFPLDVAKIERPE